MTNNLLTLTHILNYFQLWEIPYLAGADGNQLLRVSRWNSEISYYCLMLEHMLVDAGYIPKSTSEVEKYSRKLFKNQRIIEVGCRTGVFLRFLADHGANVVGTTSEKYLEMAKQNLGRKGKVMKMAAGEIHAAQDLRNIRPTSIISLNLFDRNRWKDRKIPGKALVRGLYRITTPDTKVYVQPSMDSGTLLRARHLLNVSRIHDLQLVNRSAQGERRASRHRSYRFRVQRKRTIS